MIMALIRALIRRRLGTDIRHCKAAQNYELDYLAIQLVSSQCDMFDNNKKQSRFSNTSHETSHPKGQSPAQDQAPEKVFVWKVETAEVTELGIYSLPYSKPAESNDLLDTDNTKAQRVVLVRKRLGDLCKWTSSASKPALALARSIEKFLDAFHPNGLPATKKAHPLQNATTGCDRISLPDVSESLDGGERIEWKIPFSCSNTNSKTEVKLLITRSGVGRWMVDLAGIEAVLSLWMANLEARNSLHDKDSKASDWRRAGVSSNVDYCRVLGEKRGGVLKRDISWWVNNPEVYEEKDAQEGDGLDATTTDSAAKDQLNTEIKVTIGFIGLSTGLGLTEPKASDLLLQYSNADIATLTAQHLFTSFMWTIAEYIPRQAFHQGSLYIGEHVKVQSSSMFDLHSNVGKLSGRKLNNGNLTRFVSYAEKQGLGTTDEILLCMIPTFSFHDRLPNDAVLGCDQPEIKLPRSSRLKDQTCARYSYFLDWIHDKKGASMGEYISIAGVARTMEFVYLMALDLTNIEASFDSNSKPDSRLDERQTFPDAETDDAINLPRKSKISKDLTTLLKLLSGPFFDILEKLLPFYELQGRKKTIVDFFTICLGGSDGDTWSDQVPSHDFMEQIGFTNLHRQVTKIENEGFALESILVKKGTARDIFGWTPFHYAAARPGLQFSNNEDANDKTPARRRFHYVKDPSRATTRILNTLKTFLQTNPPTGWWLDNFNRSPVHIAAFSGNNGLLKELLEKLSSRDKELALTIGGRDGMKPLHLAAGRQQHACVTTLLCHISFDTDIEVDVWKQSPIHTALVNYSYDCARELMLSANSNFSPETPDGFGRPLFFYLLGEGPKKKKSLGADIILAHWDKFKAQHGDNQSVLHLATSFLDFTQFRVLFDRLSIGEAKQPSIDVVNRYGETPLHLAVRDEKLDLVKGLVSFFRASPSAKNHNQLSPMMLACDIGDLSMIQAMSQNYLGSEIDGQGRSALHRAILNTEWSVKDCAQAVKLLAGVMIDVDALDRSYCSPLQYAADTCNGVAFSILCESGANIELTDKSDRNVLHRAVLSDKKHPDRLRSDLIDSICKWISNTAIDARDKNGHTPFHLAIRSNKDDTAFFVLSKDANPQIEDDSDMTPFMTACRDSYCHKFIKYTVEQSNMLESDVNEDQPIVMNSSRNNAYRDDTGLESAKPGANRHFKNFDINKVDSRFNNSALAWACHTRSVEVVDILLLAEAVSLSIRATEFHGFTPVHLALFHFSEDIVQRLVADRRVISCLGIADNRGLTPIEFAIRYSTEGCLRRLLKNHNVGLERFSSSQLEEVMDKHRETESQAMAWCEWKMRIEAGDDIPFPVHTLAKIGLEKEVEELLQFHMNAFELDEDGWTPDNVAQWYGHANLMHYLRENESKVNFVRPPCRWPSTFFDLYKNSTLETADYPSLNLPQKLKLDVKVLGADSVDEQFCYLRTKEAIPPTTKDFYFEVELVHLPKYNIHTHTCLEWNTREIAIGFCQSQVEKNRLPGWDKGTWAYHSHDGGLFIETDWSTVKHNEAICKQGDVMGAGLNVETGGFYCTRNGKEIEPRHAIDGQNFRIGKLYPCIGIRKARSGDEFQFFVTLPRYKDSSSTGSMTAEVEVQG